MFPAYSKPLFPATIVAQNGDDSKAKDDWLKNESFKQQQQEVVAIKQEVLTDGESYSETSSVIIEEVEPKKIEIIVLSSSSTTELESDESDEDGKSKKSKKKHKKKSKKKHSKKKKEKKKKKKKKKTKKKYSSGDEEDETSSGEASESSSRYSKRSIEEVVFNDPEYRRIFDQVPKDKLNKAVFIEDIPDLTYKHAFRIDKHGDMNNLCFDSVYHKYLPFYHVPEDRNERRKKVKRREYIRRMMKSRYYGAPRVENEANELPDEVKQTKISHYRMSENLKLYFELKSQQIEKQNADVNKTGDYNKYLNEHPNDVPKWLEFLDYQDTQQQQQAEAGQDEGGHFLYNRKLAIFEKAIERNHDNLKLNLEFIRFRASHNDTSLDTPEKIEAEFQKLILGQLNRKKQDEFGFFSLFYIWFEYLNFMAGLTKFGTSRIKKISQKFFQFFLSDVDSVVGEKSSVRVKCLFSHLMLYLIRFHCKFQTQTGYDEKAIGVYQALLDFNFTTVESTSSENLSLSNVKNLFEVYYETNLPKYGEQYSSGWFSCLEKRDELFKCLEETGLNRYETELDDLEQEIILKDFNEMRVEFKWSSVEKLRGQYNWYPFYPQIQAGESADDCIDSDRLVKFEEDLSFLLLNFGFVFKDETSLFAENYRFRLILQYFEHFNVVAVNHETFEAGGDSQRCEATSLNVNGYLKQIYTLDDDGANDVYFRYLDQQLLSAFGLSLDKTTTSLFSTFNLHRNKSLIENFIQLKRQTIKQALNMAKTRHLKENLCLLKWNFEFYLLRLYQQYEFMGDVCALSAEEFKLNFLSEVRVDLSQNENRSSLKLWLQYAILKYYLSETQAANDSFREIRKVFEMLFKLPHLSRESALNLCCVYIEIELGIYKRMFNLKQAFVDTSDLHFELANFGLSDFFSRLSEPSQLSRNNLIEMICNYCLNKSTVETTKPTGGTAFKIGLKNTTKDLLIDKELEQNYYTLIGEASSESTCLYYKLYSYYLILKKNFDKLFVINDAVLLKEGLIKSGDYLEFYIGILNYLHYSTKRLRKNDYKARLFRLVNFIIKENSAKNKFLTQSLNLSLQVTLLKYKTDLFDKIFGTQLIEVNDLDLILNSYIDILAKHKLNKYLFQTGLTLIVSDLYRINKIRKNIEFDDSRSNETVMACLGFHNQLRKRFDKLLDYLPRSLILWLLYFKFEYLYAGSLSSNKLVYIYYQSIRSLPLAKEMYVQAVTYLPEKFDEIMKWLANKELRVRIPVEELDMILEPLKHKYEMDVSSDSSSSEGTIQNENTRSSTSSSSSCSSSDNEPTESQYIEEEDVDDQEEELSDY